MERHIPLVAAGQHVQRVTHLGNDHVGGRTEPMLWIADACCGTITQLRCGDRYHYHLIESKVTIIGI